MSERGRDSPTPPTAPTVVSLYAVQAPHRPLRLSCYPWTSRGKTHHRLFLHWKGPSSSSAWTAGDARNTPSNTLTGACLPWEGGHRNPNTSGVPAPIHIAVVCPESEPPTAPPAPAFDSSDVGRLPGVGYAEIDGEERGSSYREPIDSGRGQRAMRNIRKRVKFTVRVRLVGPPRIVLEGR